MIKKCAHPCRLLTLSQLHVHHNAIGYALSIHEFESKTANGSLDEVIDRMNDDDDIPDDLREFLLDIKQQVGNDILAMMSVNWKKMLRDLGPLWY